MSTAERIGAKNQWVGKMRKSLATLKVAYAAEPSEVVSPTDPAHAPKPTRSPLVPRTVDPKQYRPTAVDL